MGDKKGQDFDFGVTYSVANSVPSVTGTSISPEPASGDSSAIDPEGNITLGKKDSASINFDCDTDGWAISKLQIKGKNDWGEPLGNNAQKNFPDADPNTGNVPADADGNFSLQDANEKANSIDYRIQVKSTDGTTVWADPRVRNIGR